MTSAKTNPAVSFDTVSIVFGNHPERALPLMDQGQSREEIQSATGQVLGVHDCRLDVGEGEIVVLMGLSGSGKSTLLRAVNGLNPVAHGKVMVRQGDWICDPARCSAHDLRRLRRECVSMVFQQFGLLPWRTVADNVGFGLELAGLTRADREARIRRQLDLVGLAEWGARKVHELSGGMQQRVGLARAFATDAPILLMDEPFSALDPLIRAHLQDELLELQDRLRRTIIFVSHDLDEAIKLGSRISIMEGGRIIQTGTPQDIVVNPVNQYVSDFVAHMNPLNVLRAVEVMRPLGNGEKRLPESHDPAVPPKPGMMLSVPEDTPLRELIAIHRVTGEKISVARDSKCVGIVDADCIYAGLLKENRNTSF